MSRADFAARVLDDVKTNASGKEQTENENRRSGQNRDGGFFCPNISAKTETKCCAQRGGTVISQK